MKRLLLAPLILGLTAPAQARPYGFKPALKVEQCISATVQSLHTTWPDPKHDRRAIIALSYNPKFSNLGLYLGYGLKEYEVKYFDSDLRKWEGWDHLGIHPEGMDIKDARKMYKPNDRIKLCLKFVPVECRKFHAPDVRGEIYSITNERTKKTNYARYGKNYCGGA